jgi:prepilin-type N-terminal cleavage/methylation domain-containing protein
MRGFTLVEIILTTGIIAVLMSLAFPLGMSFYKSQQLEGQGQFLLQVLRKSQQESLSGNLDSSFGIYFSPAGYTLFKGISFAGRDILYDEVFEVPGFINISGLPEVVFSKIEGDPNVAGNIILSSGDNQLIIDINEKGRVNFQ